MLFLVNFLFQEDIFHLKKAFLYSSEIKAKRCFSEMNKMKKEKLNRLYLIIFLIKLDEWSSGKSSPETSERTFALFAKVINMCTDLFREGPK